MAWVALAPRFVILQLAFPIAIADRPILVLRTPFRARRPGVVLVALASRRFAVEVALTVATADLAIGPRACVAA